MDSARNHRCSAGAVVPGLRAVVPGQPTAERRCGQGLRADGCERVIPLGQPCTAKPRVPSALAVKAIDSRYSSTVRTRMGSIFTLRRAMATLKSPAPWGGLRGQALRASAIAAPPLPYGSAPKTPGNRLRGPAGQPTRACPDCKEAERLLGWPVIWMLRGGRSDELRTTVEKRGQGVVLLAAEVPRVCAGRIPRVGNGWSAGWRAGRWRRGDERLSTAVSRCARPWARQPGARTRDRARGSHEALLHAG